MSAESSAALLALEKRLREQIRVQLNALTDRVGTALAKAVNDAGPVSAGELLSREDVHKAFTGGLARAQSRVTTVTQAGYLSAARLGKIMVSKELARLGHDTPSQMPDLGDYLKGVLRDIEAAFGNALFDMQKLVREGFDGVTGDAAQPARVLTTNAALKRAVSRLGVRAYAAGSTALHRGFSDAQVALYRDYRQVNPFIALHKRWTVTSAAACPSCAALDGSVVPLDTEFDRTAGALTGERPLPVYRDLHTPPRHPNCRCRLVLQTGDATA